MIIPNTIGTIVKHVPNPQPAWYRDQLCLFEGKPNESYVHFRCCEVRAWPQLPACRYILVAYPEDKPRMTPPTISKWELPFMALLNSLIFNSNSHIDKQHKHTHVETVQPQIVPGFFARRTFCLLIH